MTACEHTHHQHIVQLQCASERPKRMSSQQGSSHLQLCMSAVSRTPWRMRAKDSVLADKCAFVQQSMFTSVFGVILGILSHSSSAAQSSRISSDVAPPCLMWLLQFRKNNRILSQNLALPTLQLCWVGVSQRSERQQACDKKRVEWLADHLPVKYFPTSKNPHRKHLHLQPPPHSHYQQPPKL